MADTSADSDDRDPRVVTLVAGWPRREGFGERLADAAQDADVIVLIAPTTNPSPDGLTPVEPSRAAVAGGASLRWILAMLGGFRGPARIHVRASGPARIHVRASGPARIHVRASGPARIVLASHLNPILAYGVHQLVRDAAEVGVAGLIVSDVLAEDCDDIRRHADRVDLALVPVVPPGAPLDRVQRWLRPASGPRERPRATGRYVCVAGDGETSADWDAAVRAVAPILRVTAP